MIDKAIKGLEERIIKSQRPQKQLCKGLHHGAVKSDKGPFTNFMLSSLK